MIDPVLSKAEQIKKVQEYEGEDKIVSSLEVWEKVKNQTSAVGFMSGLPQLDKLIDGFEGGEVISISGKTGSGKTLLAQTFTQNLCKQRLYPLWFSYEMTARQFLSRFQKVPMFYMPQVLKEQALTWIDERIYEARVKFGIKAVFIDHLHFLIDLAISQNASLRIGQIVRNLKKIALKHEIVIFLLCHVAKTYDITPSIDTIRDSSLIASESDIVLIIWRMEDNEEKSEYNLSGLSIEKSRRTGAWKKKIRLIKQESLLYEVMKDDTRPTRPASHKPKPVFDKERQFGD